TVHFEVESFELRAREMNNEKRTTNNENRPSPSRLFLRTRRRADDVAGVGEDGGEGITGLVRGGGIDAGVGDGGVPETLAIAHGQLIWVEIELRYRFLRPANFFEERGQVAPGDAGADELISG